MSDNAAVAVPHEPEPDDNRPIGGNELAQGLLLVRASAMNVARLHLAAEGMDRRRMLESMDDLVALDRKIGKFVADIPTSDSGIDALQDSLEEQRRALAREKLSMGAGISLRRERDEEPAIARGGEANLEPVSAAPDPADTETESGDGEYHEPRKRGMAATLCVLLLAVVIAAAAFLYWSGDWRDVAQLAAEAVAKL